MAIDSEKVKRLRERLGLSLQGAADKAGFKSRQQWHSIELGKVPNPTVDTAQRIAKALSVKVDDLLK